MSPKIVPCNYALKIKHLGGLSEDSTSLPLKMT